MKDERIVALDARTRLTVTMCDCGAAAAELARAHLAGQTAATYLAEALAGVALLGAETSRADETVTFRLDVPGPLEGFLVEATAAGTLRGYTKRKILNDFDGLGAPKDADVLGASGTCEIIRSVPGAILASGTVAVDFTGRRGGPARALDEFHALSLQRRVRTALWAEAGEDGVPTVARGVMVECAPDGDADAFAEISALFDTAAARTALMTSPRTLLKKLRLPHAELRASAPLSFACRCSAERARAMLAALPASERAALPPALDITCHLCGRTWTVPTTSAVPADSPE